MPDDFDVLARGVEDLDDVTIDHQLEEGCQIDIVGEAVNQRDLFGAGDLDEAELRPVSGLAHEFRVDRNEGFFGKAIAQGGKRLSRGDPVHAPA